jgi:hypothetical protein
MNVKSGGTGQGPIMGPCKHDTEFSGAINSENLFGQLCNYQLLNKDLA